eukprot:337612_1
MVQQLVLAYLITSLNIVHSVSTQNNDITLPRRLQTAHLLSPTAFPTPDPTPKPIPYTSLNHLNANLETHHDQYTPTDYPSPEPTQRPTLRLMTPVIDNQFIFPSLQSNP